MPNLGTLVVKILGDTKDIKQKLNEYGKKVDGAKKATDKFSSGVKNSFKNFIKFGAIIGGAFLAVRKLTNFIKGSLDAYGQQERAITELNSALEATGKFTPQLSDELQQLASDLQNTTTYGDEATLSAMAMLQSLADLSGEGLKQAIPLVQNLAAGMNIDLNVAASLMGKTLGSTTNALSRYGIVLDATASPTEKLAALQEQINEKFGGRAAAIADTYSGKMTSLKNAYGDLKEGMGGFIAEGIEPLLPKMESIITSVNIWIKAKNDLKQAYEDVTKAGKENIEELTQAEIESTIKTLWADKLKLEIRIKEIEASGKLGLEEKKILTTYGEIVNKLNEYIGKLSLEVSVTDELLEKYGIKKKANKDEEEDLGELIKLTKTTTEETNALAQSLGYAGNILAGNFAPNLTYTNFALDKMAIAMQNLTEPIIIGSGSWENYTWKVKEATSALDEYKEKYDEWAEKARETINNITNYTSMAVGAMDGVHSQYFKNRNIELDNWYRGEELTKDQAYENEKERIENSIMSEEEKTAALLQAEQDYNDEMATLAEDMDKKRRKLAREEAKGNKAIAIMNSIINTAQAVTKALTAGPIFGPILAGIMAALGAAQTALIAGQPLPALATGADFITQGPQLVMVGDNPGGREHVQVTPTSSPNINGPRTIIAAPLILQVDTTPIYEGMLRATEDGIALVDASAIHKG